MAKSKERNGMFLSAMFILPSILASSEAFVSRPSTNCFFRCRRSLSKVYSAHSLSDREDGFCFDEGTSTQQIMPNGSRRDVLRLWFASAMTASLLPSVYPPVAVATTSNGLLEDLPPDAARSYLQYRIPLQIAADFYVFELQNMVGNVDDWGDINQLVRVNNNRGQGQPSRIERDFVNPMRILGLSMPPDTADAMRDAQFDFERAMAKLTKVTAGIRRDLPVEIEKGAVPAAKASWEDGRIALNQFLVVLNDVTGVNEMKTIPPAGPGQIKEYGRNPLKYFELMKKTKLCQNRGGPTLSNAWGKLMTSGYLQDSCGIPDLENYFRQ